MRLHLQTADPAAFPWGRYTGIQYILNYLLSANCSATSSTLRCPNDHLLHRANLNHRQFSNFSSSCQITILHQCADVQAFVDDQSIECASHCHICQSHIVRQHVFEHTRAVIVFDLSQHQIPLLESIVITTVYGVERA